ncbi:hypothetical protein NQ317_001232 [Molorchus minor]|uniref:A-kinase anchor protein 7-like phosphoesterase domain-containing protein n=1 Tax=Molorchus minor TaxID=1323400 RepID=A0ABQ9JCC4_9CUCU|nr:hypothetical protein NQ317_001232 [Molorchus minor]
MSTKIIKNLGRTKPIRMWIDGKCYNINQLKRKTSKNCRGNYTVSKTESLDIQIKDEIDIVTDDNGKVSVSFELPSPYYIKLGNFSDFNLKHLSEKTQTDISYPSHGQDGKLVIRGESEVTVRQTVNELLSVIGAIKGQFAPLQFISIPVSNDEIRLNFEKFKTEILAEDGIQGMEESIFQKALKLHLTVVVFTLLDGREKKVAVDALEEYRTNVPLLARTGPLKIQVAGINCMNDNHKKVDVLYANAKILDKAEEADLQKIVNDLSAYFYDRGLVTRYEENVKLHITLINTKYRKVSDSPRRRWNKRISFDATKIMEKYKEFVFGECCMDSIHLSLMSSTGEDGFYKPLSVIKL